MSGKANHKNNTYKKNAVKKSITIRDDQNEWLKIHTDINFSGFVQEKLDILIRKLKRQK